MFSDQMKLNEKSIIETLEISTLEKSPNIWRVNNTLLNNK